jgi:hypothetical protein
LLAGKIAGTLQSTGKIFMAKNMRGCRWILVLSPSQLGLPSESIHEFREKISIPVLYIKMVDEIDESSVAFNSLADVRGTLLVPFYANLTVQYCTYCNAYTVPVSIFFYIVNSNPTRLPRMHPLAGWEGEAGIFS